MIVIIDNYDSFTYNIYQMISGLTEGEELRVFRNDMVTVEELKKMKPDRLIISPGPGTPADAGISVAAVRAFAGEIPILGICLGLQCLAEAFGGGVVQAKHIVHGKVEPIELDGKGLLRNLPNPSSFTRYHSLSVDPSNLPEELEVTSRSHDGEIMGLRHRTLNIEGVQFHPESIGSETGERLLKNFIHWRRESLDRRSLLNKTLGAVHMSRKEAVDFMDELTDGDLDDVFIAAMLAALNAKGFSAEELAGCASVLVAKKRPVNTDFPVLDTCGTGGDGLGTFNISSFGALLAAACGARVAKHGNRAVSSRSGSTDFYEALGIPTNLDPKGVAESLAEEGFAFLFAPLFHGAMRHAAPVRKALGIKTIMNCLGPLTNPAGASFQLIGVFDDTLLPVMARAAKMLGVKRVWTVRSQDGLDEISPAAPTRIFKIDEEGAESEELFDPAVLGISGYTVKDLAGGNSRDNADVASALLRGEGPAALREAVCLNAGAALVVANLELDIAAGYERAKTALEDGRAAAKVKGLRGRRTSE